MLNQTNPIQAMSNYYGTQGKPGTTNGQGGGQETTCQTILTMTSMIVGLLSLFTIIALNVTNITYMIGSGGTMKNILDNQDHLNALVREDSDMLSEEIKPKIDLINNVVSYSLPSQMTQLQHIIKNEVLKQCTPTFMFNDSLCPVVENPKHSSYFKMVNLHAISTCRTEGKYIQLATPVDFTNYPSFIPGATKKSGCIRIPSFSLSDTIFGYCHNIIHQGCADASHSDQYLSVGRIADHGTGIPVIETITEWYLNDGLNRKSCSVAAGEYAVFMACTIVTETEREDYQYPGIGKISVAYLDVFGRKREWIFAESEILFDYQYAALYFSVGSGVIINDTVFFLIYGGLVNPINVDAQCYAPGCSNPSQINCNMAQKPTWFYNRQIVNGIFKFSFADNKRPNPSVTTISPEIVWFGAEGRLMYFPYSRTTYIYTRSSSWHSLPQTGIIELEGDMTIRWTEQSAIARPGGNPCNAANRCPKECITGVYTDLYPLGHMYEYSVGVYLSSQVSRVNPTLVVINQTSKIYAKTVTTTSQAASYTTTTCFSFKMKLWCISIVELSPGTVGEFVPIPFLYHLNLACTDHPTGVVDDTDDSITGFSLGPVDKPKTECYLIFNNGNTYFAVKIFGANQSYKLVWKPGIESNTTIEGVNYLCEEVLRNFPSRGLNPISETTIVTDHVTLIPVTVTGGVRMPISTTSSLTPPPTRAASVKKENATLGRVSGNDDEIEPEDEDYHDHTIDHDVIPTPTRGLENHSNLYGDNDYQKVYNGLHNNDSYPDSKNNSQLENYSDHNKVDIKTSHSNDTHNGTDEGISSRIGEVLANLDTSWARKYRSWLNDGVASSWGMFQSHDDEE
ncbi:cell attachment protein [Meliandou praomys virus]|uniref:Cell attachment protein n=1 Tax=Meliandou praomys virus TaxID=2940988 RepID=A0AAE9HRH3_9MONO|nr:cell attachment protein [Meliandou praomys virus]